MYDRSDGFYRRQLVLTTKEKPVDRVDDPYLAEKMKNEAESIFLWAFEGLQRLVRQNFKFTESPRIKANRENVKRDNNNVLDFLESEEYIRFQAEASASSKELYESYRLWCEENSMTTLKNRSFSDAMIAVQTKYNLVRMYIVIHCKLHIIYFFRLADGSNMTVSLFFGKEDVQMQKAQFCILRFAKYKGPEISNIEAHNERKKKNMPVIRT